jgi:hypothetical protein
MHRRLAIWILLGSVAACGGEDGSLSLPDPDTLYLPIPGAEELREGVPSTCDESENGYLTLVDLSLDYNWAILDHMHVLAQLQDAERSGDDVSADWTARVADVEVVLSGELSEEELLFRGVVADTEGEREFTEGDANSALTSGSWVVRSPERQAILDVAWEQTGDALVVTYEAIGTGRVATYRRGDSIQVEFSSGEDAAAVATWDDEGGEIEVDGVSSCWTASDDGYCSTPCS